MLTLEKKKGLINDLSPYLKKLEKEEQNEPKTATKRKKLGPCLKTWIGLETIVQSEVRKRKTNTVY